MFSGVNRHQPSEQTGEVKQARLIPSANQTWQAGKSPMKSMNEHLNGTIIKLNGRFSASRWWQEGRLFSMGNQGMVEINRNYRKGQHRNIFSMDVLSFSRAEIFPRAFFPLMSLCISKHIWRWQSHWTATRSAHLEPVPGSELVVLPLISSWSLLWKIP